MDAIERLEEAARKAREFTHTSGERVLTLRRPTNAEAIAIANRHGLGGALRTGTAAWLWLRYQLEESVVAWTGVRERDLVPGGDSTAPVSWSPRAVRLLLDCMPEEEMQALALLLTEKTRERNDAIGADAGNSARTPSGPSGSTACANSQS